MLLQRCVELMHFLISKILSYHALVELLLLERDYFCWPEKYAVTSFIFVNFSGNRCEIGELQPIKNENARLWLVAAYGCCLGCGWIDKYKRSLSESNLIWIHFLSPQKKLRSLQRTVFIPDHLKESHLGVFRELKILS